MFISVIFITVSNALRVQVMIAENLPPTQLGWNVPPIFSAGFFEVSIYIIKILDLTEHGMQLFKMTNSLQRISSFFFFFILKSYVN